MKSKEVIEFFGSIKDTAQALGLSFQAVFQWPDDVPSTRRAHVELAMRVEQERRDKEAKKEARKKEANPPKTAA